MLSSTSETVIHPGSVCIIYLGYNGDNLLYVQIYLNCWSKAIRFSWRNISIVTIFCHLRSLLFCHCAVHYFNSWLRQVQLAVFLNKLQMCNLTKNFPLFWQLVKELGAPVEYIVLPTFAYEHKIFVGPFSRKFPRAQIWVAPRQWSWPLNLPLEFFGIFRAKTLKDEDLSTPWADEIEQKVLSSPEVGNELQYPCFKLQWEMS